MEVKEAYKNLEDIVVKGFLTDSYKVCSNKLVLKTLNELEYSNMEYYLNSDDNGEYLIYRIIFSTLMLDGYNVLIDRDEKIKLLYDFYNNMPVVDFSKIAKKIDNLHNKYLYSLRYLEGFSYTDRSRYVWKSLLGNSLATEKLSGIEGTSKLGMNSVQNNWIAINKKLDGEDEYEKDFHLSILVASAFNSKGSSAISRSFDTQKDELQEIRSKIAEYGYDELRYKKERSLDEWSKPIKSRDDIVRELEKQIKGEKDKHDLFIESWIERQKKLAELAKKSVEEKQIQYREKISNLDTSNIEGSRIATPEDISNMNKRSDSGIVRNNLSHENYEKRQAFIKKVSSVVLKSDQ